MPPTAVYSAGFEGRTVAALYRGAVILGATVLDLRSGCGMAQEWDFSALNRLMGGYYRPFPAWRMLQLTETRRGVEIRDFEAGMAQFEAMSGPIVLLTRSRDDVTGHRAAIARMIEPRGYPATVFAWEQFESEEPGLF